MYVATGSYTGVTFDVPNSSSTYIIIKKATASDLGTEEGWDSSYDSGPAAFTSGWSVQSGYWDFDGVTGGGPGSWTTGHGFKITHTGAGDGITTEGGTGCMYLKFRHIEIIGSGPDDNIVDANDGIRLLYSEASPDYALIEYCWIHYQGRVNMYFIGSGNGILQYS